MEHLALEIIDQIDGTNESKYVNLPESASITITDTSEIFASGDVWSHSFKINVYANAHIFGTSFDVHGSRLHEQIDKRSACLWVDGIPLFFGYLKLSGNVEVDKNGDVTVAFESGKKTFDEMIEGANANQVPLMTDVEIGMALWRKRYETIVYSLNYTVGPVGWIHGKINGIKTFVHHFDGETEGISVQPFPRMVFPKGMFYAFEGSHWNENHINVDYPYTESSDGTPTHPYCNIALCYQKYDYKKKKPDGSYETDYSGEPEAQRDYEYMPANRVNSAPNFFVIYWLRCLMKHLGIYVEENQMMEVEDLRRLFLLNLNCDYEMPEKLRNVAATERYGKYYWTDWSWIDGWLVPQLFLGNEHLIDHEKSKVFMGNLTVQITSQSQHSVHPDSFEVTASIDDKISNFNNFTARYELNDGSREPTATQWPSDIVDDYVGHNNLFHRAFATNKCFPNVSISQVISALEDGFGIRFLFNNNFTRVRIILLRNIFNEGNTQILKAEIVDNDVKMENNIRGFRMTYGNSEDTTFYYKGFADKMPHKKKLWIDTSDKHDYSNWSLANDYHTIIKNVSASDKTCYLTPNNGNAYGFKVQKDTTSYQELYPSLFEYAGFMDAEDGDCTGEDETIKKVTLGFTPAIMTDLNMAQEKEGDSKQRFALFVDEKMKVRRFDFGNDYNSPDAVYPVYSKLYVPGSPTIGMMNGGRVMPGEYAVGADFYIGSEAVQGSGTTTNSSWNDPISFAYNFDFSAIIHHRFFLSLQDNYEPNDDGVSPIETHDCGLTFGIMRGSGSDAYVKAETDPDDGHGNLTWDIVSGSSATAHPDTCDNYGKEWIYSAGEAQQTIKVETNQDAVNELSNQFPNSNVPFYNSEKGYLTMAGIGVVYTSDGTAHRTLFAWGYSKTGALYSNSVVADYQTELMTPYRTASEIIQYDAGPNGKHMIVELDSNGGRKNTLLQLCAKAYGNTATSTTILIDHGIESHSGRFSLKLRAEKPNPYFDQARPEDNGNRRYLEITDQNLRGRGLCDQFYKEYSYWIRNARTVKRTLRMGISQLISIDKTKRVTVGDVTGFIRKMQYSVSNKTGLGNVTMEIMYI